MLTYNIHHVAIAVENLDDAIAGFKSRYNVTPISRETVHEQGVTQAMVPMRGSYGQLLGPPSQAYPR